MFGRNDGLPVLLVLASTYPRWLGDPEPGFVHELCKRLTDRFRVIALSPHAAGAPTREVMEGVLVLRYRYAPEVLETLVNDGGIVANMSRAPWKWLLLPGFLFGLLWSAWRVITRERPDVVHAHWLIPQGLVIGVLGVLDRRTPPFLATSHGADYLQLLDHDGELTVPAGVRVQPTTLFVDASGRIVLQKSGELTQAKLDAAITEAFGELS